MKLAPGSVWNTGIERRIAHPVVRPRDAARAAPAPRWDRAASTRSKRAPSSLLVSVRVARTEGERKAVGDDAGLAVARRVEALRLDRRVGRDPAIGRREAIAAFEPPAVALRVEVRGQVVAERRSGRSTSSDW